MKRLDMTLYEVEKKEKVQYRDGGERQSQLKEEVKRKCYSREEVKSVAM